MKKDWKAVKTLCGLLGFGWDPVKFLVTAKKTVWEERDKGRVYTMCYLLINWP